MKLIINRPKLAGDGLKYPVGWRYKDLLTAYMSNNDCYYGDITEMSYNDVWHHWDITAHEAPHRVRKWPNEIFKQVDFWKNEGYKVEIASVFYDYDSDKRYVSGVRYWLYPKED